MDTAIIIAELGAERDRLDRAITALRGGAGRGKKPSRPVNRIRRMSAAARRRISLAQKKRWAALKKQHA